MAHTLEKRTRFVKYDLALTGLFRGAFADLRDPPQGNIPWLDVLRTFAILAVFGCHFASAFNASTVVSRFPLFLWGWSGVDLFFVLSGLLIGMQLWKELQRTGNIAVGRFLLRRGLRIWPLYFAFVLLLAVESFLPGRTATNLWADALFVSNYFDHAISGGWSLSTEEQFYILAPACLWLFARKSGRLWILGLLAMSLPVIARAIAMATSTQDEVVLHQQMYTPIHTHAETLAMGVVIAWWYVHRNHLVRSVKWRATVCSAMLACGTAFYLLDRLLLSLTALAFIFGAAVLFALGATPRSVFGGRAFYWMSRLSYGMYLNHFGVLARLRPVLLPWRVRFGEPAFWGEFLLCLSLSTLVALATFQFVEWPFLVLRSRWLKPAQRVPNEPVRVEKKVKAVAAAG